MGVFERVDEAVGGVGGVDGMKRVGMLATVAMMEIVRTVLGTEPRKGLIRDASCGSSQRKWLLKGAFRDGECGADGLGEEHRASQTSPVLPSRVPHPRNPHSNRFSVEQEKRRKVKTHSSPERIRQTRHGRRSNPSPFSKPHIAIPRRRREHKRLRQPRHYLPHHHNPKVTPICPRARIPDPVPH